MDHVSLVSLLFLLRLTSYLQYRHTPLYCALLYHASQMLCILQAEGKCLHYQKDYDLLYSHSLLILVVWNKPHNISEYACIICVQKNTELNTTELK